MKRILITVILTVLFASTSLAQQDKLTLSSRWADDSSLIIDAQVNTPGYYSIAIHFTSMENFSLPYIYFTSISSSGYVLRIKPTDPNKAMSISYQYIYVNGHAVSKIDENFVYLLPFSADKSRVVRYLSKLNDKYESEETKENWHHFLFEMEKGDTVRAIRKGVVISITDKYMPIEQSSHVSYTSMSNELVIEHSDGTICEYDVLEKGSFMVKVGDVVFPGDPIAKAGTYNNKDYQLRISIDYQKPNKKSIDLKDAFIRTSVDPVFSTTRGDFKLIDRERYTAPQINDQIRQKEMSKKELKSLTKN